MHVNAIKNPAQDNNLQTPLPEIRRLLVRVCTFSHLLTASTTCGRMHMC